MGCSNNYWLSWLILFWNFSFILSNIYLLGAIWITIHLPIFYSMRQDSKRIPSEDMLWLGRLWGKSIVFLGPYAPCFINYGNINFLNKIRWILSLYSKYNSELYHSCAVSNFHVYETIHYFPIQLRWWVLEK